MQKKQGWYVALLVAFSLLLAGGQVYAAPPGGVGFVSNGSENAFELSSSYVQDMLILTISAPKSRLSHP
jgi:hypothetical protein